MKLTHGSTHSFGSLRPGTVEGVVVQQVTFGALLRELRAKAGLTQEELAAAAGLSPRSVSDLERGVAQTARKDTARLLADALSLEGPDRTDFEATARGRSQAPAPVELEAADTGGTAGATAATRA